MVTEAEIKDNKELEAFIGQRTAFEAADRTDKTGPTVPPPVCPSIPEPPEDRQTDRQLQPGSVEPEGTTSPSELELRSC